MPQIQPETVQNPAFARIADFRAEAEALDATLAALTEAEWRRPTAFKNWSVFDHVGHLCISDRTALQAVREPAEFSQRVAERMQAPDPLPDWKGELIPALGAGSGAALRALWLTAARDLATALEGVPRDVRIPWFGPAMSPVAFAVARLMESWAHGETIHDALVLPRPASDRLRHVCELGWRTRGFSLFIHGQPPDTTPIRLELRSPGGEFWSWGDADAVDRIIGDARDFARVVCQCRNVQDTGLAVQGEAARNWMAVAQCFVGGPSTPPPPGARTIASDLETR